MINIRTIKKLADGDGLTLKNGKIKRYKSGYQVATNGVEVISPEMAIQAVREFISKRRRRYCINIKSNNKHSKNR